jgi:hypothetical protein
MAQDSSREKLWGVNFNVVCVAAVVTEARTLATGKPPRDIGEHRNVAMPGKSAVTSAASS